MKQLYSYSIIFFFSLNVLYAQSTIYKSLESLNSLNNGGFSLLNEIFIEPFDDGSYYLTGLQWKLNTKDEYSVLIKYNRCDEVEWAKKYEVMYSTNEVDELFKQVVFTKKYIYALGRNSISQLDLNGNLIRHAVIDSAHAYASPLEFIVHNEHELSIKFSGRGDHHILRLDQNLNVLWFKQDWNYPGSKNGEKVEYISVGEELIGSYQSGNLTQELKFELFKINKNGINTWKIQKDPIEGWFGINSTLHSNSDGTFILIIDHQASYSSFEGTQILKFNANGEVISQSRLIRNLHFFDIINGPNEYYLYGEIHNELYPKLPEEYGMPIIVKMNAQLEIEDKLALMPSNLIPSTIKYGSRYSTRSGAWNNSNVTLKRSRPYNIFNNGDIIALIHEYDTTINEGRTSLLKLKSELVKNECAGVNFDVVYADTVDWTFINVPMDSFSTRKIKIIDKAVSVKEFDFEETLICAEKRGRTTKKNLCFGDEIELRTEFKNSSFTWSDGSYEDNLIVTFPGGVYWVDVSNECGIWRDSFIIDYYPNPKISYSIQPTETNIFTPITFTASAGVQGNPNWQIVGEERINKFSFVKKIEKNGNFPVHFNFKDEYNCEYTYFDTVNIRHNICNVPNTFTPNNDGVNDLFGPMCFGIEEFSIKIINQWGEMIYEADNTFWDGMSKGKEAPNGIYIYSISTINHEGTVIPFIGKFNVCR